MGHFVKREVKGVQISGSGWQGYRLINLANPPVSLTVNVSPKVSSYGQDEKHTCLLMKDVLGFLLSKVCKRMALLTPCLLGLGSDKQRAKPRFMKHHRAKPRSDGSHKGYPGSSQDARV